MNTLHYIILSGLLVSILSISGVALIKLHKKLGSFVEKNLLPLSAVSAGIFLVTSFLLVKETLEILPLSSALISFAIGIVVYVVLHRIFHHHRLGEHHDHGHNHKQAAWKVLIGDAIHNIADGLLLVSSFAFGNHIGFLTTLSIMLHEIPQEISEFLVLKKAGYSTKEAGYKNFATATSIFVGIGIGIVLINTEVIQAYLLGATATFFLGIVVTDLFPVRQILKEKNIHLMFSSLVLGILIMSTITMSLGHSHGHEAEHHYDDEHHDEEEHHHDEDHGHTH